MHEVRYKQAKKIKAAERDRNLGLNDSDWLTSPPPGWDVEGDSLRRIIKADSGSAPAIPEPIEEVVLRFPSAPVHGLQRLHEHQVKLDASENFHTFRVLRSTSEEQQAKPIKRIFLMHTGLNEVDRLGLYYRLASRFIEQEPATACIVRPFPGHMTRYPFQAFAETPLDKYLWDGSHLFRQFMRFMIETQWFLSTIARRSSYRCASGADLLAEADTKEGSRLDPECLATEMRRAWLRLHEASTATEAAETPESQPNRVGVSDPLEDTEQYLRAILALRETLNLERDFPGKGAELDEEAGSIEPSLHVLGYSLGGFTAQSVFMSWAFLVSSCSTVLAGGALRELAPTSFADPEEWQTVLHSLRYELDDRMMSPHLGVDDKFVAGIDRELFTYFKRTFYEVFQQEYRGSIQTRYKAFRERMLFIVGGNDPVVRPETVLQSGPKGGLNLLEIGGLGHFMKDTGSGQAEMHQRTFWLPEMAMLIHRFADNAAKEQEEQVSLTWFDETLVEPNLSLEEWNQAFASPDTDEEEETIVRPLSPTESIEIEHDGALPGELFERTLDDLLYRISVEDNGVLFALRNEVPTVLLPPSAVRETAAALYHDDLSIVRYCHGITARREVLRGAIERICVVLPANSQSIMQGMDAHRAYPSQAESAGGCVAKRLAPEEVWEQSMDMCFELGEEAHSSIRRFDGSARLRVDAEAHDLRSVVDLASSFAGNEAFDQVPSMPDCWIWISDKHLKVDSATAHVNVQRGINRLIELAADAGGSPDAVQKQIRDGHLRLVSVSRARYNPRFRGRLIVDGSAARKLLIHAALCLAMSEPLANSERDSAFT